MTTQTIFHRVLSLAILLGLGVIPTYGQTSSTTIEVESLLPTAHATHTSEASPVVDGSLSDDVWRDAQTVTGFTQREPNPGRAASQQTEVRLLYDDAALYVGARLYDEPDSVVARLFRRDENEYSDWFGVGIDGNDDDRTAFTFAVNPKGVQRDVLFVNDSESDANWDAVWETAVRIDSMGWVAEMRIPFSQLQFPAKKGEQSWGFNLWREIARRGETAFWAPIPPDKSGYVSRSGTLRGLRDLPQPHNLEIEPYVSSRLTRAPGDESNPFYESNALSASVGGDISYGLTSDLTLTATINPDFGQVEVDPAVVNLSAYETFFPEKRPFFTKGMESFQFGQTRTNVRVNSPILFYSRRIGAAPERQLRGHSYVDAPEQTTIASATKLSGKMGEHWSVGVLDAVTLQEEARYVSDGEVSSTPVEPLSNYAVGNVQRDLFDNKGFVGGFLTTVHRNLNADPLKDMMHGAAYVGGTEFEYAWNDRNWIASGYVAASRVSGSSGALAGTQQSSARYFNRPDASYLDFDPNRTQLTGHTSELALQKAGGGRWRTALWLMQTSPGFDANDLGFQSRADFRVVSPFLEYQVNEPNRYFREYSIFGFGYSAWNFGGDHVGADTRVRGYGQLKNFWTLSGGVGISPSTLDDRLTRSGPLARSPTTVQASLNIGTDSRKALSFDAGGGIRQNTEGGWDRQVSGSVEWRPSPAVQLSIGPELSQSHDVAQYVTTVSDPTATATYEARYIFANLSQTTLSIPVRLNWTFTPDLSLQLFAQPFVSSGQYNRFKEFTEPETFQFDVYGSDRGEIERDEGAYRVDPDGNGQAPSFQLRNPDFNVRSLRGNAVLRWEYRPGSTLYLVWQQQRSAPASIGTFSLDRDYGEMLRAPAENQFVVKLTYWLDR